MITRLDNSVFIVDYYQMTFIASIITVFSPPISKQFAYFDFVDLLFSILRALWVTRLAQLGLWNLVKAFRHPMRRVLQTEQVSKRNIEDRYLRVYLWLMPGVRKCVHWLRRRRKHAPARNA